MIIITEGNKGNREKNKGEDNNLLSIEKKQTPTTLYEQERKKY